MGTSKCNIVGVAATTGIMLDTPAMATKASQITAFGDTNHPINSFVGSVSVPDASPMHVAIWAASNVPVGGTITAIAKVVATSFSHSAEFDLHAKWRATSPSVTVLTERSTEDADSINPDG